MNCSRGPQPLSEFASAKDPSVLVKRCLKCRSKDNKQKKRLDVREKRNERGREKKYYQAYRAKKRSADEVGFLKHNAEVHALWIAKNPGYTSEMMKNLVSMRVSILKSSSKVRRIAVDLTDGDIARLVEGDCAYCGKASNPGDFNGVDRMDSVDGYKPANVVSCCQMCNYMKGSLDPLTFIGRCKHITGVDANASLWPRSGCVGFDQYEARAARKGLSFELTQDDFRAMRKRDCRYCRRTPAEGEVFGIDRLDNSVGYVDGNCVTACSECNFMKRAFGESEFAEKCAAVAGAAGSSDFAYSGATCLHSIVKRV
jgi:hypothetical protein